VSVQRGTQGRGHPVVVLDEEDVHAAPPWVASERYTSETLWVAEGAGLWCPIRPRFRHDRRSV
jgi:hypothetical protein